MAHPIPAPTNPTFKKGDRVQHADSGIFGTVYQDQTDPLLVHICWDKTPNVVECFKSDAVRVAPWHEINIRDFWSPLGFVIELNLAEPKKSGGDQYGGAVKADPVHIKNFKEAGLINAEPKDADTFLYKKGDRVKFKFNRNTGTVTEDQPHYTGYVHVQWDQSGKLLKEAADTLVALHAPRDTDPANPNQEAIDAIEALRVPLKQEIEALQTKLGNLTTAKKILERG